MIEPRRGAGVIATNALRTRFFVQRKDATYPRFPRGYSCFGGACEAGESPEVALARELHEELGEDNARRLLDAGPRHVETATLSPNGFVFALFEVIVDDATLDHLERSPVFEGECGVVLGREAMAAAPFVWGLGALIASYLRQLAPA